MTTFGWDASHYDAPPTTRDGIDFYTHKVTEGDHFYEDSEYRDAMNAARGLGIAVLGSYHVQHGRRSVANQADWWLSRVRALTPWWSTVDCWTWQIDAEQFDYMTAPTIDEINALGDAICVRSGCPASAVLAYAPTWVYGSSLTRLRYRVWASSYGTNPVGPYRSIYPGDSSSRWNAPVDPLILQYGSRATIAGQTTCDANAFRGTLPELITALGGNMPLTTEDLAAIRAEVLAALDTAVPWRSRGVGQWAAENGWSTLGARAALEHVWQRVVAEIPVLTGAVAEDATRDAAVLAAVEALANAGGVDAAPIIAAIRQESAATRDQVTGLQDLVAQLQARIATLEGELADYRAAEANAAQAAADVLRQQPGG